MDEEFLKICNVLVRTLLELEATFYIRHQLGMDAVRYKLKEERKNCYIGLTYLATLEK